MTSILDDDPQATEYRRLRSKSGQYAADRYLAEELRAGNMSPELLKIAADKIDPDVKAPRGRPAGGHLDPVWHEIGQDFEGIMDSGEKGGRGKKKGQAYSALAEEYGSEKRTIENLVRSYRKEIAAAQAQHHARQDELNGLPAEAQRAFWDDYEREMAELEAGPAHTGWMVELPELERLRKDEDKQFMQQCPHGCTKGCQKDRLLTGRHLCPFSASPRSKSRN